MISYDEAVSIVRSTAQIRQGLETQVDDEVAQLADILGRRASHDVISPIDTPLFDSSAMDGYAVSSALAANASPAGTLCLRVEGTIAAGDPPLHLPCDVDEHGRIAGVEIMTGAQFPQSSLGPPFDACVPVEHTETMQHTEALSSTGGQKRTVKLMRSPKSNQNRRFAGHDFRKGDIIVAKGMEIGPQHVMAMASVGIDQVLVQRRIRAIVMTTGSELQDTQSLLPSIAPSKLPDCNSPFLCASLRSSGTQVTSITGVSDDVRELQDHLTKVVSSSRCDILITTGGVSAGKFDFVPEAVLNVGGRVHFHHVAMRPGHPVLFASLPRRRAEASEGEIAMFGLPGNPIAAAACYRFLVVPYLRVLLGQRREEPAWKMKIAPANRTFSSPSLAHDTRADDIVYRKDQKLDAFCHAQICGGGAGVTMSSEQSPGKVRPFACANCWVHIRTGISDVRVGEEVDCYPLESNNVPALGPQSM